MSMMRHPEYGDRLVRRTFLPFGILFTLGLIVIASLFFGLCAGVNALATTLREQELRPRPLPALYSGAEGLEQRLVKPEGYRNPVRQYSFTTTDNVNVVRTWYERSMQDNGWSFWTYDLKNRDLAYFGYSADDAPTYRVNIEVKSYLNQTLVTVQMYSVGSDWNGEFPTVQSTSH